MPLKSQIRAPFFPLSMLLITVRNVLKQTTKARVDQIYTFLLLALQSIRNF